MNINRAAIKQNAKTIISDTRPNPILVGLVYLAIVFVLDFFINTVSGQYEMTKKILEHYYAGDYNYVPPMPQYNLWSVSLLVALAVMVIMINVGFTIYCMNICRFRRAGFGNLFDGFAIFGKVLWLHILMFVLIYLWSLLLIVPGIIAFYRYRMALYIMIDNPQLSAIECIRESKRMMNGRKGELFMLDLSFLGWMLLTTFPFVIVWVKPYTEITYVNYYLALRHMPYTSYDRLV